MREFTQLIDFMKDLGVGVLDHLPEEQRIKILSVEEIVDLWMQQKSYLQALSLRKDITSYVRLVAVEDDSVDQLFADFDLCFIQDRFGCEDEVFLTGLLDLINLHIETKRQGILTKYLGWLGYR